MKNKLFLLFKELTNRELKKLEEKLTFAGQKEAKTLLLFKFLKTKKAALEKNAFKDLKTQAFTAVFADKNYDAGKLRKVMAVLQEQLEDFLLLQSLKKNKERRETALLEVYQEKNWYALWLAASEEAKKQELEKNRVDSSHFKRLLELEHRIYFYANDSGFKEKELGKQLLEMNQTLDVLYLISKLRYCCEAIAIRKIRAIQVDIPETDWALQRAKEERFAKNPLVGIWYKLILAFENSTPASYLELKKDFFELIPLIGEEERLHLLYSLVNVCWFSFDKDNPSERSSAIFALYFEAMEFDVLLQNGLLSPGNFFNIIDLGFAIKEVEKVKFFMAKYTTFLRADAKMSANIELLTTAFLLFNTGKFQKIPKILVYLDYEDVSYGFRAHTLLIKALYEEKRNKGYEEIDQKCAAFKQYIVRKYRGKYISKSIREENMNFIKIMLKLPLAQDSQFAKITKAELLKEVIPMRVKAKGWLLEKIREIR